MTIWFEFPTNRLSAVRSSYAAIGIRGQGENEDEVIKTVVPNADGTQCFTGSDRATAEQIETLRAEHDPHVTVHDNPSFMDTWEYPLTV
jgi:hypothetical protein